MDLPGRAALITGGRRIGAAVAERLARHGVDVAVTYQRSRDDAERAAAGVTALRRRGMAIQADLSTPAGCTEAVEQAARAFGRLDVLVNMASVYSERPFDELTLADWQAPIDVDLRASYLCSKAAVPHFRARGGGRIVNMADWTARSGRPRYKGFLPYYVAKAGVVALTEALALELAADQILVNAIAPGPIVPPAGMTDDELKSVEAATPLGRWGGEGEIAKAVIALLESDFITGETIRADGGRHLR
ncbi:MAG: SDR family NAD(P)-dependent oxidoreductase [Vicinamibacterales bacterium]